MEYSVLSVKTKEEFDKALKREVEDLFEETFGLAYAFCFFDEKSSIQVTSSNLIRIWKKIEAYNIEHRNRKISDDIGYTFIRRKIDSYEFLKRALECNFPFSLHVQRKLGIYIDRSNITVPDTNHIKIQIAAQIIMSEEKNPIKWNLAELRRTIKANTALMEVLDLPAFQDERTFDGWIKPIVPFTVKRGSIANNDFVVFDDTSLMACPGIKSKNSKKINYQKLYYAIEILGKVLIVFGKSQDEIIKHPVYLFYKEIFPKYIKCICDKWLNEAIS